MLCFISVVISIKGWQQRSIPPQHSTQGDSVNLTAAFL